MLKIPKLKTLIKVKQHRILPENSIIKNCTISMDNKGVFYASLCVEYVIDIEPRKSDKILCNYQTDGMFVIVDTKMIEIIMQQ